MTAVPTGLPLLRQGNGRTPADGGCLVQIASFLRDGHSWVDDPAWLHPTLTWLAIYVNDHVTDGYRPLLAPLAADLASAEPEPDGLPSVIARVRMATWVAQRASYLWRDEDRAACQNALAAAAAWVWCPCTGHRRRIVETHDLAVFDRVAYLDNETLPLGDVADSAAGAAHAVYWSSLASVRTSVRSICVAGEQGRDTALHELLEGAIAEYQQCTCSARRATGRWDELCDLIGVTSQ